MPNWKTTVKIGDLHTARRAGEITVKQVASSLAARLERNRYSADLWLEIEDLKDLAGSDESESAAVEFYDEILRRIYDFGDDDHRIWLDSSS